MRRSSRRLLNKRFGFDNRSCGAVSLAVDVMEGWRNGGRKGTLVHIPKQRLLKLYD